MAGVNVESIKPDAETYTLAGAGGAGGISAGGAGSGAGGGSARDVPRSAEKVDAYGFTSKGSGKGSTTADSGQQTGEEQFEAYSFPTKEGKRSSKGSGAGNTEHQGQAPPATMPSHGPVKTHKRSRGGGSNMEHHDASNATAARRSSMGGGGDKYREVKKKDDKMDSGTRMTPSSTLIQTSLPNHPKMAERPPYVPGPGDPLTEAGVARANIAPDREHPLGTTEEGWAERHKEQSVMQQHCEYFDPDHDGVIWPRDTYNGCRNFGWGIPLSLFATFIIHLNLSYPTVPGKIPDPFFRIWYANAYRLKHGSDSMTYDFEGRYRPQFFEEIFTRYDRDNKGGLTFRDVLRMWAGQRMAFDFYGWCATFLEWLGVYLLLWPEDGVMRKDDIRRVYDGSIFYKKAEDFKKKRKVETELSRAGQKPSMPLWRRALALVLVLFTSIWAVRRYMQG